MAEAAAVAEEKKAGKVKAPNEAAHKTKMDGITSRIAVLEAEMKTLAPPPKDKNAPEEKGKGPKSATQIEREQLLEQLKPIKAAKDELNAQRKAFEDEIEKLSAAIAKFDADKPPKDTKFRTAEEIDKQVAKLEGELTSTSHKLADEKKLVNDINDLKRSKKTLAEQATASETAKANRARRSELLTKKKDVSGQIRGLRDQEDVLKEKLDKLKEAGQSEFSKRFERRNELKAELDKLYQEKREEVTSFRAQKDAHWEATREEREAVRQKKIEEKKAIDEQRRKEQEARQKEWDEYEASLHPWETEMKECELLKEFLLTLAPAEAAEPSAAAPKAAVPTEGIMRRAEEDFFVGKQKPAKKDKAKAKATPKSRPVKLDTTVFAQFLKYGIKPPTTTGEVPDVIAAVLAKKEEYKNKPRPEKKAAAERKTRVSKKAEAAAEVEAAAEPEYKVDEEEMERLVAEEMKKLEEASGAAAEAAEPAAAAVAPAPKAGAEPVKLGNKPAARYLTFDNDGAHGKQLPPLDTLSYLKGDAVAAGLPLIVVFWAKFAEGDYATLVGVSDIVDAVGIQAIGISCDNDKTSSEKFLELLGGSLPQLNIKNLRVDFPLAYDEGKKLKTALQKECGMTSLGPSAVFLVNDKGTIVWREQFSQGHPVANGQIGEQAKLLVANEPLVRNGDKPVDDNDEEEMNLGDPDDDGLLF